MDGGAWWAVVHVVARSQTQLSDFTFTFHFHAPEKEMATHSGVLAWRIPGTGEPGALLSMGSHRVGHDWSDLAAAAAEEPDYPRWKMYRFWLWQCLNNWFTQISIYIACKLYVYIWSFQSTFWSIIINYEQTVKAHKTSENYCFSSSHVWMWELDHKKTECWRIDAFELWGGRRLLRVPWTARSNQSILKEISPEYSLEGLMLKLKLQYFGHLIWRTNSLRPWCWKRLKAGGKGDNRGWDGWMASPTQWTWVWASSGRRWRTRKPGMLQSMG